MFFLGIAQLLTDEVSLDGQAVDIGLCSRFGFHFGVDIGFSLRQGGVEILVLLPHRFQGASDAFLFVLCFTEGREGVFQRFVGRGEVGHKGIQLFGRLAQLKL